MVTSKQRINAGSLWFDGATLMSIGSHGDSILGPDVLPEPRTYQGHGWTLPGPNGVMGGNSDSQQVIHPASRIFITVDPCNIPPIPTPSWGYDFSRAIQSHCPFRSLYHSPLPSSSSKPYPSIWRPQLATPLRKLREISASLRTRCRRPINPHVVCGSLGLALVP